MKTDPWPHIIVDDFLDNYDWHIEQVNSRHGHIQDGRKLRLNIKDFSVAPDIQGYLDVLPHRPYETLRLDWYWSVQKGPFEYKIHAEDTKKVLSVVVYLGDNGRGTDLYNPDKSYYGEVEWKPNRAFIFAGSDVTWHSYRTNADEKRITLNGFLYADQKGSNRS